MSDREDHPVTGEQGRPVTIRALLARDTDPTPELTGDIHTRACAVWAALIRLEESARAGEPAALLTLRLSALVDEASDLADLAHALAGYHAARTITSKETTR